MHNCIEISKNIFWVGASDKRLARFENLFPVPKGVSYNSYLICDQKTTLLDTVDNSVAEQFIENVQFALDGKNLDYLVINHMEPDHSATITRILELYPTVTLVLNYKTSVFFDQFVGLNRAQNTKIVAEGEELVLGEHTLRFFMTPMVHWPEVMMSYEKSRQILFSADAFGSFGSVDGQIFSDMVEITDERISEMRRYYSNIVGKYGVQVNNALKKLSTVPIKMLAPLHGLVWRNNLDVVLDKYLKWASYQAESDGVMIAYASMYGNTKSAAYALSTELSALGVKDVTVFDVSVTDVSYLISEAFKKSKIVLASVTYNNNLYPKMEQFVADMCNLMVQNKTFALIENGSWAPQPIKLMREYIAKMKNCKIIDKTISIRSALKTEQYEEIKELATELASC